MHFVAIENGLVDATNNGNSSPVSLRMKRLKGSSKTGTDRKEGMEEREGRKNSNESSQSESLLPLIQV
jgi:hypothetical protein